MTRCRAQRQPDVRGDLAYGGWMVRKNFDDSEPVRMP